jgi:hypothetical protein
MDKKQIKRIIAREGIVLLGFIASGLLLLLVMNFVICPQPKVSITVDELYFNRYPPLVPYVGLYLMFFGYPCYLLIRFIIWAVRTLKNK